MEEVSLSAPEYFVREAEGELLVDLERAGNTFEPVTVLLRSRTITAENAAQGTCIVCACIGGMGVRYTCTMYNFYLCMLYVSVCMCVYVYVCVHMHVHVCVHVVCACGM